MDAMHASSSCILVTVPSIMAPAHIVTVKLPNTKREPTFYAINES